MNGQRHIIYKEVLDLTTPDRERAVSVQNKASGVVRQRLNPALEQTFSKIADSEEKIRIDKLVVDIGVISEKDLDQAFVEKAVQEVENKIRMLLKTNRESIQRVSANGKPTDTEVGIRVISSPKDALEQFIFFLRNGRFPWWHKPSEADTPEEIFSRLLEEKTEDLKNLLVPVLKEPAVRKRLVFQLDKKQLDRLLKRIDEKKFEHFDRLFRLLIAATDAPQFRRALTAGFYEALLRQFGTETGPVGESRQIGFIKEVLDSGLIRSTSGEREPLLLGMLRSVMSKLAPEAKPDSDSGPTGVMKDILEVSLVTNALKTKEPLLLEILRAAVLRQTTAKREPAYLASAVLQAAVELPLQGPALFEMMKTIPVGNTPALHDLAERLKQKLKKASAEDALDREQAEGKKTEDVPTAGQEEQEALPSATEEGTVPPTESTEEEKGDADKGPQGESPSEETLQKADLSGEVLQKQQLSGRKIPEEDEAFSLFPPRPSADGEEVFVYNAGLVLLHPFLRYFFEGLGLLDETLKFKTLDDSFKAIHLLQFIVTGEESAPEYDLVLNKVLCGVEVTEPVPKDYPISEKEKEESIHLIKTILERWEALKTTKPEALRHTYLQREGIMKQSGQGWNLTIERNTLDVMLEKLPWAISIVKFPWSTQILYVEW